MLFFLLLINVMFVDLNCFSQVSDVADGPLVNKSWHKASFGNGDSSFIQIQGSDRFPREDNNKIGRGNTLTLFLKSYPYNQLSPNISQIILQ